MSLGNFAPASRQRREAAPKYNPFSKLALVRCCDKVCLELKSILGGGFPFIEHSAQCAMLVLSRALKEIGLE